MKRKRFLYLFILLSLSTAAQKADRMVYEQCGTMERLETKLENNPALRSQFEQRRIQFNQAVSEGTRNLFRSAEGSNNRTIVNTIPVVFHVVMSNPNAVTTAQLQKQLDTLNRDFLGANGDSVKIPSYFKSLFGKSVIQFCLAQQTPDGQTTSGIERITTNKASFTTDDAVKHATSGGADIWNSDKYFNVWICALSNNTLGYATFPEDGISNEQGVVIDYRSLPGGSITGYSTGKTLTHETGHFFNLYHIWGDDEGACSGTDFVDDTPNQSNSSSSCASGIRTDNCTTSGNGIMYQNYMDYTPDGCLVMFTKQQVARMESALSVYRSSLLSSDGCQPPVTRNYDVQLRSIDQPLQRLCSATFTPAITIKNNGMLALTSLTVSSRIDNGSVAAYTWTGNLASLASVEIQLNSLTASTGNHTLTVYTAAPNGHPDEETAGDTIVLGYQFYNPVTNVSEGFEGTVFPPAAWDIVNPDGSVTWQRVTGTSKTGNGSVMLPNFEYSSIGQKDDLRLPVVRLDGVDSAFLSFDIAAAAYTSQNATLSASDTLEVLASTDCWQTYTSIYKKSGSSLVTRESATTLAFTPSVSEWRKDSVNLANYIGKDVILSFRNTTGYENNIYLDDINVRTVTVNPNLKSRGFLVTPNPSRGLFEVQFYPQPSNLKAIQVYNTSGQKIKEIITNGQVNNYTMDISGHSPGTYIVRAVFSDKILTKKFMKL